MKCTNPNCLYEWAPKVKTGKPLSCPRCRQYLRGEWNIVAFKSCQKCGKEMTKKPKETHEYWKIKQFCSSDCYGNFLEGKSKPENLGEKNGQWRGKDVSYGALHDYIKWHLPKPDKCERCGKNKRLDLANISQEYKHDLSDWEWLCRLCHMTKDV